MAAINVEKLLQEISPDAPAGPDLEYDPDFLEMRIAAQPKRESEFGKVKGATGENWPRVQELAASILTRSKDLRAAVILAHSALRATGLGGLRDAFLVLNGLVDRYWDTMHPVLDPTDNFDPMARLSSLADLQAADGILVGLEIVPLVEVRGLGRFSLRDLAIAQGKTPAPVANEGEAPIVPPTMATIDAAFLKCELSELQATAAALSEIRSLVPTLGTAFSSRSSTKQAPDLKSLEFKLGEIGEVLKERLARRGVSTATEIAADTGGKGGAVQEAVPGQINSREDVIRVLDKACSYFREHEPSSPVPLLLERAKRLASKDFLEILADMAPDGLSQARVVGGVAEAQ
ncbi:MAG: type VI secretion system protein TssA [Planctomycetota bacterium]